MYASSVSSTTSFDSSISTGCYGIVLSRTNKTTPHRFVVVSGDEHVRALAENLEWTSDIPPVLGPMAVVGLRASDPQIDPRTHGLILNQNLQLQIFGRVLDDDS